MQELGSGGRISEKWKNNKYIGTRVCCFLSLQGLGFLCGDYLYIYFDLSHFSLILPPDGPRALRVGGSARASLVFLGSWPELGFFGLSAGLMSRPRLRGHSDIPLFLLLWIFLLLCICIWLQEFPTLLEREISFSLFSFVSFLSTPRPNR